MDRIQNEINQTRKNLHMMLERYPVSDPRVIELSQKLDQLIVSYMKEGKCNLRYHLFIA